MKQVNISDADTTPLRELGIKGVLLEKLESSQVFTAGQLGVFLESARFQKIPGIGQEQIGKLGDCLLTHHQNRAKPKAPTDAPPLAPSADKAKSPRESADDEGLDASCDAIGSDLVICDCPQPRLANAANFLSCCSRSKKPANGFGHPSH